MKRGAWCAAVIAVGLTGCKREAPPPEAPSAPAAARSASAPLQPQPVFTSLEEALRTPQAVYRLHLEASGPDAPRLQALPPEVGQLVKLQELRLAGHALRALPAELGRLPELRVLDVTGNQLESLPESLAGHARLESLLLAHNALQHFPPVLMKLPALRELTLHFNPLQIPHGLVRLGTLRHVEVDASQGDIDALREARQDISWEVYTEEDRLHAASPALEPLDFEPPPEDEQP